MSESSPGIAIIGAGYWGKNLIRNYHHLGVLKLICDKNETLLDPFHQGYPGVDTCLAFHDLLSREDLEGVVIATPAETHFPLAQEALLADKHVFVEKPFVLDPEQGAELIAIARDRGLTLMVGHLLQYHPVFIRLRELADSGELGRINYIYSNRLNLGKIRREENILWSFAPHDISMILALAGESPDRIFATGGNYLHQKIADVTTTHLAFPSGLKAHIFVSWLHPFKEQKLVVVGDRKMAVFDDTREWGEKLLLYPHRIQWRSKLPVPAKAEAETVDIPQDEPLRLECEHFLDCVRTGQTPRTDGREGLEVLRILRASQQALDEGEQVQAPPPSLKRARSQQPPSASSPFIHESAVVDGNVIVGPATRVWHFSHLLADSRIGANCTIGQNVAIGPEVVIGDGCKIQNNVSVYKGVTLEDGVFCGPSMVFTNVYNPRAEIRRMDQIRPTLVRQGATIGANATIICGTTIGRYAFIGAGAVVNKNVADYALVVGNPARRIGWVCQCGERLPEDLACGECGRGYRHSTDGIALVSEQGAP